MWFSTTETGVRKPAADSLHTARGGVTHHGVCFQASCAEGHPKPCVRCRTESFSFKEHG